MSVVLLAFMMQPTSELAKPVDWLPEQFQSPPTIWACDLVDSNFSRSKMTIRADGVVDGRAAQGTINEVGTDGLNGPISVNLQFPEHNGASNFFLSYFKEPDTYFHLWLKSKSDNRKSTLLIEKEYLNQNGEIETMVYKMGFCMAEAGPKAAK